MNATATVVQAMPEDLSFAGHSVGPGPVLAELHLESPLGKSELFAGLKVMGFSALNVAFVNKHPAPPRMRIRFVGRLARSIEPVDTDVIHWAACESLLVDPFAQLADIDALNMIPFVLETGALYEMKFLARVKSYPNARSVARALEAMGFEVGELIALPEPESSRTKTPGPNRNLSHWFGRATWSRTLSIATPEDPFYFAEMRKR